MRFSVRHQRLHEAAADVLVVGVHGVTQSPDGELASLDRRARGGLSEAFGFGDFKGKEGQLAWVPVQRLPFKRVLLAGLGAAKDLKTETVRTAMGTVSIAARRAGVRRLAVTLPTAATFEPAVMACAIAEGLVLGSYDPEAFKTKGRAEKGRPADRVLLIVADTTDVPGVQEGARRGAAYAHATNFVRDLGNRPSNVLTPPQLAAAAREMAARYKGSVTCTVWGPREMEQHRMGGILGVGRGSAEPSQFIQLEYRPRGAGASLPKIAFVGKGLTFDTGGISLKPAASMDLMKMDMCGAGAVLGAIQILAELQLRVHVLGYIAAAENMPDGRAIKPGDLLTMMNGMTVEVNNTDAEGRLVLADALHHATRQKPAFIVDVATLTGACQIALGDAACGLMSEDDDLVALIERAALDVDEPVWRLPLNDSHRKRMEGHVADLKNTGAKEGGALTAAGFLSYFTRGSRWAHLDIAGMAWAEETRPCFPKGATGYGARLLAAIAEQAAASLPSAVSAPATRRKSPAPRRRAAARLKVAAKDAPRATSKAAPKVARKAAPDAARKAAPDAARKAAPAAPGAATPARRGRGKPAARR
jgi:leucyl aminopeptidase